MAPRLQDVLVGIYVRDLLDRSKINGGLQDKGTLTFLSPGAPAEGDILIINANEWDTSVPLDTVDVPTIVYGSHVELRRYDAYFSKIVRHRIVPRSKFFARMGELVDELLDEATN